MPVRSRAESDAPAGSRAREPTRSATTWLAFNARFLSQRTTGTQRYARAIHERLRGFGELIEVPGGVQGMRGHLWEQAVLPYLAGGKLLWSPCNTGPLGKRRQVVTVHDASCFDRPECFSRQFAAWYQWLLPRLARTVRRVLTVSEFSKARIADRCDVDPGRIVVIPNGIDASFRPACPESISAFRSRSGLAGEYLLAVGSVEPRKNLRRLLAAWGMIDRRYPELTLAIAGATEISCFKGTDLGIASIPPRVKWLGYAADADLPALYSGATAFVFPSLYEGFGLPPLEAMACGTPVACSGSTSLPEVVGDAAVLFDPAEPEAIATAISRLLDDRALRDDLSRRGPARARLYNWDRAAEMTLNVLEKAAGVG